MGDDFVAKVKYKRLFRIVVLILFSFTLNSCNYSMENVPIDSTAMPLTIYQLYAKGEHFSLAKVQIQEIEEDLYYNSELQVRKYLLMKCVIEEDFYENLNKNDTIYVPVLLKSYLDKSSIEQWLFSQDSLILYFSLAEYSLNFRIRNEKTNVEYDYTSLENLTDSCSIDYSYIIPIQNNKVDFTTMSNMSQTNYFYKLHKDYTNYVEDGMALEVLVKNLRGLALLC